MAKKQAPSSPDDQRSSDGRDGRPAPRPPTTYVQPVRSERRPEMIRQRRDERRQAAARKQRDGLLTRVALAAVVGLILAALGYMLYLATQMSMALEGVQQFSVSTGHSTESVAYDPTPPVGGEHDATPQTCGFYAVPVRNENAVHSLEHGALWITYQPELPTEQLQQLQALARQEPKVLVSPYIGLPSPVVASSWGRQLRLDGAEDDRLEQFIRHYRGMAPEPAGLCVGVGAPL
jgi:hypothetical protein